MNGATIKIIDAQQAKLRNNYKRSAFVGDKNISVVKMHGATIKIIDAQQAKLRNNYKRSAFVGDKNISVVKMHGATIKTLLLCYTNQSVNIV